MTAFQIVIKKQAKAPDVEFIHERIRDLQKLLKAIEKNTRTKNKY